MPLLEQALGPFYDSLLGKKKEVKKEVKKEIAKEEPASTKKPAKVDPTSGALPKYEPVKRAGVSMIPVPDFAQADPLSPQELQAAIDYLLGTATPKEKPTFSVADLEGTIDRMDTPQLPLDLRAIGGISDTLYGTRLAQTTPNRRAETLAEEKAIRELRAGSPALQQVKGQARLAEFEHALKRSGEMTPLEKSQMILNIRKALGGGSEGLAEIKAQAAIIKQNLDIAAKASEENRDIDKEERKELHQAQTEFEKSPFVTKMKENLLGTRNLRSLLTNKSRGVNDHETVLRYIKNIEKDSAVMFNEANALTQANGLLDRVSQISEQFKTGGSIPPPAKEVMLQNLAQYEEMMDKAYAVYRVAEGQKSASRNINPKKVVEGTDTIVKSDRGTTEFKLPGSDKIIRVKNTDLHKFYATPTGKKAVKVGGGH